MRQEIVDRAKSLLIKDGLYNTCIDEVKLFKTQTSAAQGPLVYDLCLVLVLNGQKTAYLGEYPLVYDVNNYLVIPTTLPFETSVIASEDEPLICMLVGINKEIMFDVMDSISLENNNQEVQSELGAFTDSVSPEISDIVLRLLKVVDNEKESKIFGDMLLKEMYYRVALGKNSHFLHKIFDDKNHEAKIAKALRTIRDNYNKHLDIPTLARDEDMSTSSFHAHFKKITSYSPLQYIKHIRLNKAKEFLLRQNYQVNDAAYEVGYESVSQFSRDFKAYFGCPPKELKPPFDIHSLT